MGETPFMLAVDRAEAFLEKGLKHYVDKQRLVSVFELARTAETYRRKNTDRVGWTGRDVDHLVSAAQIDPVAFDALKLIAVDMLNNGDSIPQPLASFIAEVLNQKIKRPNKYGRYEGANEWRDRMIALAVLNCEALGLPATRNDETGSRASACDAVAEALKRLGQKPSSYKRIKEIWLRFKREVEGRP